MMTCVEQPFQELSFERNGVSTLLTRLQMLPKVFSSGWIDVRCQVVINMSAGT